MHGALPHMALGPGEGAALGDVPLAELQAAHGRDRFAKGNL